MPSIKDAAVAILFVFSLFILNHSSKHHRHRKQKPPKMVTSTVYNLCHCDRTVSSEVANDTSKQPYKVFKELFEKAERRKSDETKSPTSTSNSNSNSSNSSSSSSDEEDVDAGELRRAKECGDWGDAEPSRLFLKVFALSKTIYNETDKHRQIYHDALATLQKNPLGGVVSPPLMGSNGVVPLTIVAPLPDLCRHMANCIVRAEKEVFLATNYWIFSDASTLITNALRELSRRAGERGEKVVVKVLYDRGDPRQVSIELRCDK